MVKISSLIIAESKVPVEWETYETTQYSEGFRLKIKHPKVFITSLLKLSIALPNVPHVMCDTHVIHVWYFRVLHVIHTPVIHV